MMITPAKRIVTLVGVFLLAMLVPVEQPIEIASAPLVGTESACAAVQVCCDPALDMNCTPDPECEDDDSADGNPVGCDETRIGNVCGICSYPEGTSTQDRFDACNECAELTRNCRTTWTPHPNPPWTVPPDPQFPPPSKP